MKRLEKEKKKEKKGGTKIFIVERKKKKIGSTIQREEINPWSSANHHAIESHMCLISHGEKYLHSQ